MRSPADLAIENRLFSIIVMLAAVVGGIVAYNNLARFEDPEFTIRVAQILTQYPGATPEEVANEVTEPLETILQEMQEVDEIKSVSRAGYSEISVTIKYGFSPSKQALQVVWTKLRNKINDAQRALPPGAGPSYVFDDFGDVYGLYYLLTGEGYAPRELLDYAEDLRISLLQVDGVGKVVFAGEQQEVIYLEIERDRIAALGVSLNSLYQALATQNIVAPAGSIKLADTRVEVTPTNELDSVRAIEELLVPTQGSSSIVRVKDIATVKRQYREPQTMLIRYNGEPALGIGVASVLGANVVKMGEGIDAKLEETLSLRPMGMELHEFYHQGKVVDTAIQNFARNVALAVAIVFITLLAFMGLRSGLVMGAILILTIASTLATMYVVGIPMHRISLGALIIALGMLVDNAIVVTEGILTGTRKGKPTREVARKVVTQTKWPLLGGTVVGIIAFAPIGFAPGDTAEYTQHLFWVILISLLFSWAYALTLTPLFCHWLFKPSDHPEDAPPPESRFTLWVKSMTRAHLQMRWLVLGGAVGIFALSVWGFRFVPEGFFPASTTPQISVDYWLPEGTDFETTNANLRDIEEHIATLEGVEAVQTLVGGGTLRYLMVYQFESRNTAYGQLLVKVDDYRKIDGLVPQITDYITEGFPNAQSKAWRFILGPGGGSQVEATFQGPDPKVLRRLANEAKAIMREDPGARFIKDDWRDPVSVFVPVYSQVKGGRSSVSREDFTNALQQNLIGRNIGIYREDDKLIPIVIRTSKRPYAGFESMWETPIISSRTGAVVPLSQVIDRIETQWRDAQLRREDRILTIKAQCDPYPDELASLLEARIKDKIEAIDLPAGYTMKWEGVSGRSAEASGNLFTTIPLGFLTMVLTVVLLFNAVRQPLVIWLVVPLAIIGVTVGLILTDLPLEFMALLGVLSLSGLLIKNAIVLVDQTDLEIREGKPRLDAVIDSTASRVRPVMMGSLTTVLGVMPLFGDAFFKSMAAVLVFGLSFATLLTLVVVPALYAVFFRIGNDETATASA